MNTRFLALLPLLLLISCQKPDLSRLEDMEGEWTLLYTSGGFTGAGFDAPFDHLSIDEALDFILYQDNEIVAEGMIQEKNSDTEDIFLEFNGSKIDSETWIDLIDDNEKYLRFEGSSTMHFNAPCCDRFNITWGKE